MPTYKVRGYELVTRIQMYTTTVEAEDKFYAKEIVAEQYADGTALDEWTAHEDYDIEDAELIETAKLFSSKGNKVNVVFDDGGARTDGKTIYLPNTAPDLALSERGQRFDRAMVGRKKRDRTIAKARTTVSQRDRMARLPSMPGVKSTARTSPKPTKE